LPVNPHSRSLSAGAVTNTADRWGTAADLVAAAERAIAAAEGLLTDAEIAVRFQSALHFSAGYTFIQLMHACTQCCHVLQVLIPGA
jgi:hypothetical protein